jgi:hypothetical protein
MSKISFLNDLNNIALKLIACSQIKGGLMENDILLNFSKSEG